MVVRSHRERDDLVEEHEGRHVEVEDEVLVVVGAVGALLDGGVLLLVAHAHAHHRVHVQPRQLPRLDDRDANLFINRKIGIFTPRIDSFSPLKAFQSRLTWKSCAFRLDATGSIVAFGLEKEEIKDEIKEIANIGSNMMWRSHKVLIDIRNSGSRKQETRG